MSENDALVQGGRRGGKKVRPNRMLTCVLVTALILLVLVVVLAAWGLARTYPAGPVEPGTFITNVALNGRLNADLNCRVPFDQRSTINLKSQNYSNVVSSNFEPALAVNPTDPLNMIITTHLAISAREVPTWYTLDGGVTWTRVDMPNSRCGGPVVEGAVNDASFASDPLVNFDKNGNAYASFLVIYSRYNNNVTLAATNNARAHLMFKSTDKGRSWGQMQTVTTGATLDKQGLFGDSIRDNVVYAAVRIGGSEIGSYRRSTDGGNLFEPEIQFDGQVPVQPPSGPSLIPPYAFQWGQTVNTLSDGTVLLTTRGSLFDATLDTGFGPGQNEVVHVYRSSDGVTFQPPVVVIPNAAQTFFYDATAGNAMRDTAVWHDVAINRHNDYIYVIAQDSAVYTGAVVGSPFEFLGSGTVITMSKDKGLTWSTKKAINPTRQDTQTVMATVAVLDNGVVGVVHYTDRNHNYVGDTPSAPFNMDAYVSLFDANLIFLGEHRITPSSFNLRRSNVANFLGYRMYDIGEYMKGSNVGNCFVTPLPVPASTAAGAPDLPYTQSMGTRIVVDKQYTKFARTCYNDILPITTEPVPLTKRQTPSSHHHNTPAKMIKSKGMSKKDLTPGEITALCVERGRRMPVWLKELCQE